MTAQPSLLPGDPLPRISLIGAGGGAVDLTQQLLAGRAMVLWFAAAPPPADILDQAAGLAEAFQAVDARLFVVTIGAALAAGAPDWLLGDPKGVIATAFGAAPGRLALLTPGWRLARLSDAERLGEALAWATGLHDASRDAPGAPSVPLLVIENVLEPELRDRCRRYWEGRDKTRDEVADAAYNLNANIRSTYKRRTDTIIDDPDLFNQLKERIVRRVVPEVIKCFQARITNMEGLRVGCYDSGDRGEFVRHRDNTTPFTAHRQFACSIPLNTGEYEGGWLRFPEFGRTLYQPPAGAAGIFSVSLLHEVLPVTAGRRFILLTFLYDEIGARMEQQMKARGKR